MVGVCILQFRRVLGLALVERQLLWWCMSARSVLPIACFSLAFTNLAACSEEVKVDVTVRDGDGEPVEGAQLKVWYRHYRQDEDHTKEALTDASGKASLSGSASLRVRVDVSKEGYYPTIYKQANGNALYGKHHDLQVVLKEVRNPIPLYARKTKLIAPVLGVDLGYDLSRGDWVAPHGKGEAVDVLFKVEHEQRAPDDFDYQLTVSFPNELDGLMVFEATRGSELRSPHQAPLEGYQPTWIQKTRQRPGEGRSGNRDPARNFWMRVATRVDEEGELVAANYVKIYGDFPEIRYYFNPTPNDRNLEFDPKRNLFSELGMDEEVREP